jgi:endonuclease/exonuclease/phosphatase family metal-dependent hydrolase
MKTTILFLSLFVSAFSFAAQLRVVSYNVHSFKGRDGRYDYHRIANILKELDADVIGLQEIERFTTRTGVDQVKIIKELTGMYGYFEKTWEFLDGDYGIMVLSKYPVTNLGYLNLATDWHREPRKAMLTKIHWPEQEFILVNTHFSYESTRARKFQAETVEEFAAKQSLPVVIAGDFNAIASNTVMQTFWAGDDYVQPKYPLLSIDFVFTRSQDPWLVRDSFMPLHPVASDHNPVVLDLELTE